MDTSAIEKFSVWAHDELARGIWARAGVWCLLGDDVPSADATFVVDGEAITQAQRHQRGELLARIAQAPGASREEREKAFVEQVTYTWFNRLLAIRYMEVHDLLPSRTRILSAADGSFAPQALDEAPALGLPGLDARRALELKADPRKVEQLFREILVGQCAELASSMPEVFAPLGSADSLLLPDHLLAADSVAARLVTDLPDPLWDKIEIEGWAYQFYISKRKDEVFAGFKKKRKAETVAEIGPATQLFTPEWIVRYMVENSLGRLWMLNNPDSALRERMEYYIEPEGECEDFIRIASPEDLRVLDPACGSGHILVYAFDLLAAMYEERGYRPVDAARLILEKNLVGFEIDERAAQLASFALVMKGCELAGRRFLGKGVRTHVRLLSSVAFDDSELAEIPGVAERGRLVDALAHLSECGSLFVPEEGDVEALEAALAGVGEGSLFADALQRKLESAIRSCRALVQRFEVVAGNPPYMGSSNFGAWLSKWMKKNYPDTKSDLCTAFIERNLRFIQEHGMAAQITMQSWMFLGSFEKFREKLLADKSILSMAHLGARGFDSIGGEVVSTTAFVTYNGQSHENGVYFRLVDVLGEQAKRKAYLEAIHNPDCGYFYRADASSFSEIPGTPIAYWATKAMHDAFKNGFFIGTFAEYTGSQNKTADNARFVRCRWEVSNSSIGMNKKWVPYQKGGDFRRWFGNNNLVVDWSDSARDFYKNTTTANLLNKANWYKRGVTYTMLTSGRPHFRYMPDGCVFDVGGPAIQSLNGSLYQVLAFLNSTLVAACLNLLNPSLNLQVKDIKSLPFFTEVTNDATLDTLAKSNVVLSVADWRQQETSIDFSRYSLI